MTKPGFLIAVLIAVSIAIGYGLLVNYTPHQYYLKTVRLDKSWGYDILKNNKPFIHQEYIPAIAGNIIFSDKKSAKKTGKLVLAKLRKNQSPDISISELIQLGVVGE